MKVQIDIKLPESHLKTISLDDSCFYVTQDDNKIEIDTNYKDRINTLIALFGCKNNWELNSYDEPVYRIYFTDTLQEVYDFYNAPSNWNLFIGYIDKLVGDSYDL
jgi:hypothetical protein